MLAFIPSPSHSYLPLGPIHIHAYGLMIALSVLAAVWLANKRWVARGGTADDITAVAIWSIPVGIIGARLYHVVTDNELYRHDPVRAFAIWDGGLGIWGGIAFEIAAGIVFAKRHNLAVLPLLDAVAPALALAQGIGRWGNWFNQELFGRPSTAFWALRIDVVNRPSGYERFSTFQPTFLYESLWDLALAGLLIFIGLKKQLRPGRLFAMYVAGYTFARYFVEDLRIDFAHRFFGLRLNQWTAMTIFIASSGFLIYDAIVHRRDRNSKDKKVSQQQQ